jgi:uncharacterized protein YbaR (Trm112 family)
MADQRPRAGRTGDSSRAGSNELAPVLEPWVVSLLACPVDRGAVQLNRSELICELCGRRYPVRGGIACMLPDQALSEQKF